MPILALDVGTKKIGIAYSENGLLSSEFSTIKSDSEDGLIVQILFLIKQKNVNKIVIGVPKNMDGSESNQTLIIKNFSDKLAKKVIASDLKIDFYFEDETLTTKEAERILFSRGKSVEEVRERRDQLAAKIILDQYLDR
jgi:putative Holliday junction resolvase